MCERWRMSSKEPRRFARIWRAFARSGKPRKRKTRLIDRRTPKPPGRSAESRCRDSACRRAACHRRSQTFRSSRQLIELIGQQDSTSRRAYSDVAVTSPQQLLCLLQCPRSRGTSNIDARKLIVPAHQILQWRRASHARGPPQGGKARAATAPSPAVRSIRSDETGTSRAPLFCGGRVH